MGKFCRIATPILPYLWLIIIGPLAPQIDLIADNLTVDILTLFLIFVISVTGVICSRTEPSQKLMKSALITKLVLIPFYVLFFIAGTGMAFAAILPIFTGLSIIVIILLAVIDYLILIDTSIYAVQAIIKAGSDGYLTKSETIISSILSFVFCLDVIAIIVVTDKCNKAAKKLNVIGGI